MIYLLTKDYSLGFKESGFKNQLYTACYSQWMPWVWRSPSYVDQKKWVLKDFPGGSVVKNPPANAGDTGSGPSPGRSHMPWSN